MRKSFTCIGSVAANYYIQICAEYKLIYLKYLYDVYVSFYIYSKVEQI